MTLHFFASFSLCIFFVFLFYVLHVSFHAFSFLVLSCLFFRVLFNKTMHENFSCLARKAAWKRFERVIVMTENT